MASPQNIALYSKQYTFQSPRRQNFSLPESFLDYITQNGAVYEKLIQTCKYFFARHQLVPMKDVALREAQIWKNGIDITWKYDEVNSHMVKDKIIIDLKKSKLWIYDDIWTQYSPDLFSLLLKSVHRCTPTSLTLGHQNITLIEFSKISANIKYLSSNENKFFYPDKTQASLWDILALMPKLENCYIYFRFKPLICLFTKNLPIPVLPNLKDFGFSWLPIDDFPVFSEFIKLHPNTELDISIAKNLKKIDVEAFKTMLEETFPDSSITQQEYDERIEFKWTSESQYIRVTLG